MISLKANLVSCYKVWFRVFLVVACINFRLIFTFSDRMALDLCWRCLAPPILTIFVDGGGLVGCTCVFGLSLCESCCLLWFCLQPLLYTASSEISVPLVVLMVVVWPCVSL